MFIHRSGSSTKASRPGLSRLDGSQTSRMRLTRRSLLGLSTSLFSSAFLPADSYAETNANSRLLIVILRGGMDGLGMVIPKLDPCYEAMRRELAIPLSTTLSIGSDFGLQPSLPVVHAMFEAGEAAVIPAVGLPVRNRSHFECQDNLENGLPINITNATGWLNRLLGSLPPGDPIRTCRAIEIGDVPLILRGAEPVLGWSPTWFEKANYFTRWKTSSIYKRADLALYSSLNFGLEANRFAVESGAVETQQLSVLRKGFIGAARLLRAPGGPRIAVLSIQGWDTHSQQGGATGLFNDRLSELDTALGDLKSEIGSLWPNLVVACVSEFGRTIPTNGDSGTDHGVGTAALVLGGAVKGGIYGDWPGLSKAMLVDGTALRPTVDMRSIFKGILKAHIGVPQEILESIVFPGSIGAVPLEALVAFPLYTTKTLWRYAAPPRLQETYPIARYRRRHGNG